MNRNQTPAAISASSTDLQKTCFSIFRLFSSNMKVFDAGRQLVGEKLLTHSSTATDGHNGHAMIEICTAVHANHLSRNRGFPIKKSSARNSRFRGIWFRWGKQDKTLTAWFWKKQFGMSNKQ